MNRRTKAQFKLQQTVERLSIDAITYHVVGLIGYLAKGINFELAMVPSIPIVAGLAACGIRHARQTVRTTK